VARYSCSASRAAHQPRLDWQTAGIIVLAVSSGALLVAFGGITDRLIPLFAIGALLRGRRATRSIRISCGYREETMAIQQRWSIHPAPPQFVTLSREGEHTLTIVDGVACIDGRGAIGGVAAAQFAEDASRVRSERSR
jgi:hypothetical protein